MTIVELEHLRENLLKRGYQAVHIVNRPQFLHFFDHYVRPLQTIGFGGSVTTRELGLPERCREAGKTVLDHWSAASDNKTEIRHQQLDADLFITSANAVTEDGILVNADGLGNRVAASIFGPSRVLWIITPNKVVNSISDAFHRIRNVATPMNARRLGISTPCASDMICRHCLSDQKIDRVYALFEYCPGGSEQTVILLAEPLGY